MYIISLGSISAILLNKTSLRFISSLNYQNKLSITTIIENVVGQFKDYISDIIE